MRSNDNTRVGPTCIRQPATPRTSDDHVLHKYNYNLEQDGLKLWLNSPVKAARVGTAAAEPCCLRSRENINDEDTEPAILEK